MFKKTLNTKQKPNKNLAQLAFSLKGINLKQKTEQTKNVLSTNYRIDYLKSLKHPLRQINIDAQKQSKKAQTIKKFYSPLIKV